LGIVGKLEKSRGEQRVCGRGQTILPGSIGFGISGETGTVSFYHFRRLLLRDAVKPGKFLILTQKCGGG
jgi:hypothetical protein